MRRTIAAGIQLVVGLLLLCGRAFAADPLFDQSRLHDIRLYVAPEDWQKLRDNYLADDYYVANVSLDGVVIHTVAIRSRGSGSRSGQKPALKIDMNEYVSQDYHGYKELILRNGVQDPSFLRERLAFMVFEGMGIPAPQCAFARLFVNEEYFGLYEVAEPVGKPFLKARLGEDGGNLFDYEYTTPYDFSFRSGNAEAYVPYPFKPETNESHLDASGLVDFISAINGAPDETFVSDMSAWLDLPKFLTYVAVENVLAATDGFLGTEGMNNYFLYQFDKQRRFTLIPWDKDTLLANATFPIDAGVGTNVLTRRLLKDPATQRVYLRALYETATRFVNETYLGPRLESAYAQIRAAALADPNKPFTNDDFEAAVGGLRGVIRARAADVVAQTGVVSAGR
jgi:spore coat protein CotH